MLRFVIKSLFFQLFCSICSHSLSAYFLSYRRLLLACALHASVIPCFFHFPAVSPDSSSFLAYISTNLPYILLFFSLPAALFSSVLIFFYSQLSSLCFFYTSGCYVLIYLRPFNRQLLSAFLCLYRCLLLALYDTSAFIIPQ